MSLITRVSSHCYGHSTSAAVEVVSALHAYDLDRVKHRHLSRFGHVFVGIDASSKLLIWGGLNCDACPSQTLWFTGVRARF